MTIGTILIAILVFSVLIFVHELGHFVAAKKSGIRVNEFAMGMGPKLISRRKGETVYSLRVFPIGGFCALEGEDGESEDTHSFGRAKLYQRIIVMAAGSAMNLLLGLLIVAVLTSQIGAYGGTVVADFAEGAISNAYLQADDEILRMNGHRVRTLNDVVYELGRLREGVVDIQVLRDGSKVTLENVPFQMKEIEGVQFVMRDFRVYTIQPNLAQRVEYAFNWTGSLIKNVWGSFTDLITGRYGVAQMSGPIGVTTVISEATSYGWKSLLQVMALITLNLGVFNLLPLPALDGGRLLFLLIELIRRKPIDQRYESVVHATGFALLIGLMIFVTVNDVLRLI